MAARLRRGFTTGSASSAAAKAGVLYLAGNLQPADIEIPLPVEGRLTIPIDRYEDEGGGVRVTVVKDAGDDPDVTHGADIQCLVRLTPGPKTSVEIHGGQGVGRVTLPGLPMPPGRSAINPEPRKQIEAAALEGADQTEFTGKISIIVEVPKGEELARKTMNPRLGIMSGISILGSSGIVKPFSHDSWRASIAQALDVAKSAGLERITFTTGRKSERFFLEHFPDQSELSLVQAADFFQFAMKEAVKRGFTEIGWSLFFGKLVKQALGMEYTHAKSGAIDFRRLARWCENAGVPDEKIHEIENANTARQVLEIVERGPGRDRLLQGLISRAAGFATQFSRSEPKIRYFVFDFEGHIIACTPGSG